MYTIFEIRLKNVVHLTQKVTWLERWHVTGPDDHFYYIPQLKGKDEYDNDDAQRQKRGRDNLNVYYSWVPTQHLNGIYIYIYMFKMTPEKLRHLNTVIHGWPFGFWAEPMYVIVNNNLSSMTTTPRSIFT